MNNERAAEVLSLVSTGLEKIALDWESIKDRLSSAKDSVKDSIMSAAGSARDKLMPYAHDAESFLSRRLGSDISKGGYGNIPSDALKVLGSGFGINASRANSIQRRERMVGKIRQTAKDLNDTRNLLSTLETGGRRVGRLATTAGGAAKERAGGLLDRLKRSPAETAKLEAAEDMARARSLESRTGIPAQDRLDYEQRWKSEEPKRRTELARALLEKAERPFADGGGSFAGQFSSKARDTKIDTLKRTVDYDALEDLETAIARESGPRKKVDVFDFARSVSGLSDARKAELDKVRSIASEESNPYLQRAVIRRGTKRVDSAQAGERNSLKRAVRHKDGDFRTRIFGDAQDFINETDD